MKAQDQTLTRIAAAAPGDEPERTRGHAQRDRARVRRQPSGLHRVRSLRSEYRAYRAPARRHRQRQRQPDPDSRPEGGHANRRGACSRCSTSAPNSASPPAKATSKASSRRRLFRARCFPANSTARARRSAISRRAAAASCARATPRRTAISQRCASMSLSSPKVPPAPARPGSPSGTPCRCSNRV